MLPKIDTQNYLEFKNYHKNIDKILISENLKVTKEDKNRNKLYSEEFKRSNEKDKFNNFNNYIKNLNIILDIKKNSLKDIFRIAQLTQRTNQFNSSTIRMNELDIKKIINDSNKTIYQCSAKDKFGNYGIIGLAIIEFENQTATITSFLMSCRSLGREIESYFFEHFIKEIKKLGISKIIILFKKNEKNFLIGEFLKKNCKKIVNKKQLRYYEVNMLKKTIDRRLIKINEK
jgi:FkbH-like protein